MRMVPLLCPYHVHLRPSSPQQWILGNACYAAPQVRITIVKLADRLVEDVAAQPLAGLAVTMSAGVASSKAEDLDFDVLLKQADLALYAAKRAGRNRTMASTRVPSPAVL